MSQGSLDVWFQATGNMKLSSTETRLGKADLEGKDLRGEFWRC